MPRSPFDCGRSSRAGKPPPGPATAVAPLRSITTFNDNAATVGSPFVESREPLSNEHSRDPATVQSLERGGVHYGGDRDESIEEDNEVAQRKNLRRSNGPVPPAKRIQLLFDPVPPYEQVQGLNPETSVRRHEQVQAPPPPPAMQGYPSHTRDAYQPPPPPPPPSEAGFGISPNAQPAHKSDRTQVSNGTHDKENSLGRSRTVARQPAASRPPLAAFNRTAGVASPASAQQDLQASGQEKLQLQTKPDTAENLPIEDKERLEEETGRLSTKHQGPPAHVEPENFEERLEMKHLPYSPKTVNTTAENPRRELSLYDLEDDCKFKAF